MQMRYSEGIDNAKGCVSTKQDPNSTTLQLILQSSPGKVLAARRAQRNDAGQKEIDLLLSS
jgi:hypothetical protein